MSRSVSIKENMVGTIIPVPKLEVRLSSSESRYSIELRASKDSSVVDVEVFIGTTLVHEFFLSRETLCLLYRATKSRNPGARS